MPETTDPQRANYLATLKLTESVNRLTDFLAARERPGLAGSLMGEKISAEASSQTGGLGLPLNISVPPGVEMPTGEPSQFASDPERLAKERLSGLTGVGPQWNEMFGSVAGQAGGPSKWASEPSAIAGKTNIEAQRLEEEPIRIPSFGDWRIDAQLKLASQIAGKRALSNYASYAEDTVKNGGIPTSAPEWLQEQGRWSSGNVSGRLAQLSQATVVGSIAKTYADPFLQHAYAAQEQGANLGYSPESGIGGAYIMGIRNPLAALTSEAGKQGLGSKVNTFRSVLEGGTSFEAAENLKQALQEEGFSNQKTGFLGLTTGGEEEGIAQAIMGAVPGAKTGALHGKQAAGFANVIRYGTASVKELQEALEGMETTAKTLKQGLNETSEAMQSFAEETYQKGGTKIQGIRAYKEIANSTGMAPSLTSQINESPFGQAIAASYGMIPSEVAAAPGTVRTQMASETIALAMKTAPKFENKVFRDANGKIIGEESGEAQQLAYASEITGIPAEQLKLWTKNQKKIQAATEVTATTTKGSELYKAEHTVNEGTYMKGHPWSNQQMHYLVGNLHEERSYLEKEEQEPNAETFHHERPSETARRQRIEAKEKELHSYESRVEHGGYITSKQKFGLQREWSKARSAAEGIEGIEPEKIRKIERDRYSYENKFKELEKTVAEATKPESEEGGESRVKIELTGYAKTLFRALNHGEGPKESANAGGPSTAAQAASPNLPGTEAIRAAEKTVHQYEAGEAQGRG